MKLDIGGDEKISAPVETLWKALNDPDVLTRCIPGCKTMTEIAPDAYKVEMQLRVAAVGGSFEGEIALSDKEPPEAATSRFRARVRLATATARPVSRSSRTATAHRASSTRGPAKSAGWSQGSASAFSPAFPSISSAASSWPCARSSTPP